MTFVSTGTFVYPGAARVLRSGSKLGRWAGGQLVASVAKGPAVLLLTVGQIYQLDLTKKS
jgi:hypothetical protein